MFCTVAVSGFHPQPQRRRAPFLQPAPALIVCGFGEGCYQTTAGDSDGLHFSVLGRQRSFQFQILYFFSKCEPDLPFEIGPESQPHLEFFLYYLPQSNSWGCWRHLEHRRSVS